MTVASITISLLLLALQQSAANMTTQILDQFLRRRINQAYFGFFVGLALYSLVTLTLATVDKPFAILVIGDPGFIDHSSLGGCDLRQYVRHAPEDTPACIEGDHIGSPLRETGVRVPDVC